MTERTRARLRVAGLVIVAFLLQATVVPDLRVHQVAPDLLLVCGVCAGLSGGARQGVLVGFLAGLLSDLYLTGTPVGLSALVYCVVGYCVGTLRENVLPESRLLTPPLALLATAGGVILFVAVGDIVGQTQLVAAGRTALIRTTVIEAVWNAVLAVPGVWLFTRAAQGSAGAATLDRGRPDRIGSR